MTVPRKLWVLAGFVLFKALAASMFVSACAGSIVSTPPPPPPVPTATSVGGAVLETGREIDLADRVVNLETTFSAGEDFYFSFYNDETFGGQEIQAFLVNVVNGEVLSEVSYEVDPRKDTIADMVWFSSPGYYRIVVHVGGRERATREVLIE